MGNYRFYYPHLGAACLEFLTSSADDSRTKFLFSNTVKHLPANFSAGNSFRRYREAANKRNPFYMTSRELRTRRRAEERKARKQERKQLAAAQLQHEPDPLPEIGFVSQKPATAERRAETNRQNGRGRDAGCPAPPAQIRTCGSPAYGSYLG
jgi:hypothetical protein